MTQEDKRKFIRELINRVKAEVIAKTERMPEEWDGMELRQFIADKFSECVMWRDWNKQRLKDYRNYILTTNL